MRAGNAKQEINLTWPKPLDFEQYMGNEQNKQTKFGGVLGHCRLQSKYH